MKKCPFCAEEIKAEAIKCKHCGEWVKTEDKKEAKTDGILNMLQTRSSFVSDGKRAQNVELKTDTNETIIPTKTADRGWGWFIILCLYAATFKSFRSDSSTEHLIYYIGIIPAVFIYFKLRKFFSDKWQLPDISKLASFKAGVVSYVFILILYGISVFTATSELETGLKEIIKNSSTKDLEAAFLNFEQTFNIDSSENIEKSLAALEAAKVKLIIAENTLNKMFEYVDKNKVEISKTKLAPVLKVNEFYQYSGVIDYFKSLKEYLAGSDKLLKFSNENYIKLNANDQETHKQFDQLFEIVENLENKLNEAGKTKEKRTKEFFQKNPELIQLLSEGAKSKLKM